LTATLPILLFLLTLFLLLLLLFLLLLLLGFLLLLVLLLPRVQRGAFVFALHLGAAQLLVFFRSRFVFFRRVFNYERTQFVPHVNIRNGTASFALQVNRLPLAYVDHGFRVTAGMALHEPLDVPFQVVRKRLRGVRAVDDALPTSFRIELGLRP